MPWCFEFIEDLKAVVILDLIRREKSNSISAVEGGKKMKRLKITFADGGREEKDMSEFRPINDFSLQFSDVTYSRLLFVQKFKDIELCYKVNYKSPVGAPEGRIVRPLNKDYVSQQEEMEAFKGGVKYNLIDSRPQEMSFLEKAKILRNLKTRSKRWSRQAAQLFGYQSTAEARNKLRTMAAVADLEESIWSRIVPLCVSSPKPVKQTAFTSFVYLPKLEQEQLLKTWEDYGYKRYFKEMQSKCIRKGSHDVNRVMGTGCDTTVCSTHYKREHEKMTEQCNQLMNLLKKRDSEIEMLNQEMEMMKAETEESCQKCNCQKRKADDLNDETPEEETLEESFSVGDKEWTHHSPDSTTYSPKVIEVIGNKFKVERIEDKVRITVESQDLKRCKSQRN